MFKKKVKMEVIPQSRIEIIHKNFFEQLKRNKITQKKYSVDNNVPESTISKWKNCTSNMNEDHIYQAAKYFNISVNMLYYTEQELKELHVKEVSDYDPIVAQQQAVIESIESKVCETKTFLILNLCLVVAFMIIISFLIDTFNSSWPIIFIIVFPIISHIVGKKTLIDKNTFIINYLDQLYYKTTIKKNKFFIMILVSYLVQISLVVGILVCSVNFILQNGYHELIQIIIAFGCFSFVVLIGSCLHLRPNMKEKIYGDETDDYNYSLAVLTFDLTLTACSLPFFIDIMQNPWFVILPAMLSILSIINVILLANKYSKYHLVLYDQKIDSERELFKD